MLDYSCAGGHAPLRRAVADYLRVFRSVQLDADQVIITAGTQQSIALCAQLLADHGDTAVDRRPGLLGRHQGPDGRRPHAASGSRRWRRHGTRRRRRSRAAPADLRHALAPVPDRRGHVAGPAPAAAGHRPAARRLDPGGRLRQRIPLQRPAGLVAGRPGQGRAGALHGHVFQGALSRPQAGLPGGAQVADRPRFARPTTT